MTEKKKKPVKRLLHRYTIEIQDDDTYEKKLSLKLSRLHVLLIGMVAMLMTAGVILLIVAYTPLLQYFPGITEAEFHRQVSVAHARIDSLRNEAVIRDRYIRNLLTLLHGKDLTQDTGIAKTPKSMATHEKALPADLLFFVPLKGLVSDTFALPSGHFGVDIAASHGKVVSAVLDGTVVLASWTNDDGYVLAIQHPYDLFSLYKHNAKLLKKEGNTVKAGDAVAIVGKTGELATGTHLHFELWHQGKPLDPRKYISW